MNERASSLTSDEGSGPRVVDEAERARDRAILREIAAGLPSEPMTERDREVIAEYRRRKAAGERGVSQEERDARRRQAQAK